MKLNVVSIRASTAATKWEYGGENTFRMDFHLEELGTTDLDLLTNGLWLLFWLRFYILYTFFIPGTVSLKYIDLSMSLS